MNWLAFWKVISVAGAFASMIALLALFACGMANLESGRANDSRRGAIQLLLIPIPVLVLALIVGFWA